MWSRSLDVVQRVERLPGPNEKLVADSLVIAAGGPATNGAAAAASLGVSASIVTRIGTSPVGSLIAADLAGLGVGVLDLADADDLPGISTVLVTAATGERAVVSVNGRLANGTLTDFDQRLTDLVSRASAVLVDGHHLDLAVPVAAAAKSAGVPVVLDGGSWKPGLEALLTHVDLAVVSADFTLPNSSRSLDDLRARGPRRVARSNGPGALEILDDDGHRSLAVPTLDSALVVDTLGAGDTLHGALAAWVARWGLGATGPDLDAALQFASEVATASVTGVGARGWLADAARVNTLSARLT